MSKKTVKPGKRSQVLEFTPIVLEPESIPDDPETFHAFSIGETDYYGVKQISFDRARDLYRMLQTATRERPVDFDELVCVEVYGREGWEALNSFKGLRREDFLALINKASEIVLGTLGKD